MLLFAGVTLAAKIPVGAICRGPDKCSRDCWDGRWSVTQGNDFYGTLVCDPNGSDPMRYHIAHCTLDRWELYKNIPTIEEQTSVLEKACEELGGQFCMDSCLSSGKMSGEREFQRRWRDICTRTEGYDANSCSFWTPITAKNFISCSDEEVFGNLTTEVMFWTS
jgi:hypothetical protein